MMFGQNIDNKSARILSSDSVIARALLTYLQEQTCYFKIPVSGLCSSKHVKDQPL